jgi:hypothetical protein
MKNWTNKAPTLSRKMTKTPSSSRLHGAADLSPEEIDLVLQNLNDDNERDRSAIWGAAGGKETWSRYLVENYFSRVRLCWIVDWVARVLCALCDGWVHQVSYWSWPCRMTCWSRFLACW